MIKIQNSSKGFTLIEILIVIAIIGVLSTMMIIAINPIKQMQKARDAQRKSDARQIQSALEMYRSDVGHYPVNGSFTPCTTGLANGGVTYISKVPCDPIGATWYTYNYNSPAATNNATYTLSVCLENTSDKDLPGGAPSCGGVGGSGGKQLTFNNP